MPAQESDDPSLPRLYASRQEAERSQTNWSEAWKQAPVRMRFASESRHCAAA